MQLENCISNHNQNQKPKIMYQVNFYFNRQRINTMEFGTEQKAEQCLIAHADAKGMIIREDFYYASYEGTIPEEEIEIVQIEN